ncbi:MAG TPA: hypothetical protein VGW58_04670, partial [Pyrinomonadaceae bacterium]|nr:hypothetical protein [Pyrinomonadaceae bacterium]
RQLTDFGARPAWSPDGSYIAFRSATPGEVFNSRAMPPSTIWSIPSQGGTAKQISQSANPTGGHSFPSWSPDGKRIAFEVSDYISNSVWSMAADGTEPKKISNGRQPIYAGDAGDLYFMAGDRVESELTKLRISPSGEPIGEPTLVMRAGSGTAFGAPAISQDGKKILYGVERTVSNLWTVSLLPDGDVAGPPSTFAADTSSRNSLPRFSPDGSKIALNRWRPSTSVDVWVAEADGKNLTQLTNNPGVDSQVSWLPGGDKLAFLSEHGGKHMMLWTVSISTGKQEPFLDLGDGVQFALVSRDGKQVAYNFIQNGIMNIWLASVADGKRRQLTFDNETTGFPCWSPDGRFIAYEMRRGEDDHLMLISSDGGQPKQLTAEKGKSWPHSFSPDGDKIVFAGQRDGVWNIYSISISTRVEKRLTNYSKLNSFVRYPSWSRNHIVYEYAETTGNLWMAELD